MKGKTLLGFCLMLILCFVLWLFACRPSENDVSKNHADGSICAVLAHPDDETIISGTLAKFAAEGFNITVVYVTSGDGGADETGKGLSGNALGAVREKEALQSLQAIGIKRSPIFLRYPDGQVPQHADAVKQALHDLFNDITPQVVIGFGPDGITGNWDHRMTGFATDFAFDLTDSGRLLLHMAITNNLSPFYSGSIGVSERAINVRVNVTKYANQRTRAVEAHHTQFNRQTRFMYKTLVHTMPSEKFIIARNRNAEQWLEKCFDVQDEKNKSEDNKTADSVYTSTD